MELGQLRFSFIGTAEQNAVVWGTWLGLGAEASFRIPAGTASALPGALQGVQGLPGGMGTIAENKALLGLSAATPAVLD